MIFRFLVSVVLLLLTAETAMASKRVALVIANGDYASLPKLEKVLNDARPLRETLTSDLGFDVLYGENLSRREMNRKINELDAQVESGDIVFIYFAGHGVALENENYMLPVDMLQPEPGEEKFVTGDSFGASALARKIQAKGAQAIFYVLDASRSNPFTAPGKPAIGFEKGLAKMDVPKDVFVLFSAGFGQQSLDSLSEADQDPNSLFMRNLVPLLKTPGLSQSDLAKKLQDSVSAAAASAGQEQLPASIDQLPALVTLNSNTEEVVVEEKLPADNQAVALEEWKIVKDSGNREALEGFKAKYASDPVWGPLVDEALQKLDPNGAASQDEPKQTKFTQETENKPLYRDLQTELTRIGCYAGAADGDWDPTSQRALSQFARNKGLSLQPDEDALEILSDEEPGICTASAEPQPQPVAQPQTPAQPKAEPQSQAQPQLQPEPKAVAPVPKPAVAAPAPRPQETVAAPRKSESASARNPGKPPRQSGALHRKGPPSPAGSAAPIPMIPSTSASPGGSATRSCESSGTPIAAADNCCAARVRQPVL